MADRAKKGDLRKLLAVKLGGVTQRRIYQLAKELSDRASIKTAEAIWILASQNQINLTKYLPPEVVQRVRELRLQIPAPPRPAGEQGGPVSRTASSVTKKTARAITIAREFKETDPILPAQILTQAKEMAAIYPLLYVMENSMREFLRRVVDAHNNSGWWTTTAPTRIRERIKSRMADDEKHAWHQRRGSHPIDYLDLNELPLIVQNNQALFVPAFLPSAQWFDQFVDDLYKSRCVLCHMNPLRKENVQDVRLRSGKWRRLVQEKKDRLP